MILQSFVDENRCNMKKLEESWRQNNMEEVSAVAHKMVTSFGHIGANEITYDLRILEQMNGKLSNIEVEKIIQNLNTNTSQLFPLLRAKANELQSTTN